MNRCPRSHVIARSHLTSCQALRRSRVQSRVVSSTVFCLKLSNLPLEESFPSPFFGITDVQAVRSPTPMALEFDDDLLDFSGTSLISFRKLFGTYNLSRRADCISRGRRPRRRRA